MTIYKIRYFINKKKRGGGFDWNYNNAKESIVIDNLDRAKEIYESYKNECEYFAQYSGYQGKCLLFIPHIHENGELAYWPDNEQYIERFEFD